VADVPAFPLAGEARSAFRKLAFDLEPDAFLADAPVLFVERPETSALLDRLRSLSNALLARKRITFRYHGIHRGESTDRSVEPYGMLFHHGHWYLAGHDRDRAAVRLFRTERMEDVRVNTRSPNSADFERPANFRLDDFAGREAWELGNEDEPTVNARILFRWPASLAAARNGLGSLVEERREGGAIRAFEIRQVPPFLRWLLSQEGDAVIVDPPELAEALASLARDVAAAHGRPPDGTEPNAVGTDGAHDHD
jgi:predicted DNA-binding transcriptional regulator YafY